MKEDWWVVNRREPIKYGSPRPRFARPNPKRGRKERSRQNTEQDVFVCIGSRPKRFETVPTVSFCVPYRSPSSSIQHDSFSPVSVFLVHPSVGAHSLLDPLREVSLCSPRQREWFGRLAESFSL